MILRLFSTFLVISSMLLPSISAAETQADSLITAPAQRYDRDYTLKASMLGYFDLDGTRNPVLQARKGEMVRITIINAETMTHDIALEKLGIRSEVLIEEGATTSIEFKAEASDIYFCSIPGHRQAGMVGTFEVVDSIEEEVVVQGTAAQKDGRVLNLGFETGTLEDWSATGDAFSSSAIQAKETAQGVEGAYFLSSGSGEKHYTKTGSLTSVSFKVAQPFASFRVSGGALQDTRVEILRAADEELLFDITGADRPKLQPVVVDLSDHLGEEIFIRIIDNETGVSEIPYVEDNQWAHINFDGFLFYPTEPTFTDQLKKSDIVILPPLDPVINAGLSPQDAVEVMTLQDGFSVALAAAEPDVVRPIGFTTDARGRLWVAEAHTYPVRAPEGEGKDRILIFEDTNGDGSLDKRKVFMEGLNLISAIEVGMGGVWLGSAPDLLFIPVDPRTDEPVGPPQVVLDGWGIDDTHEVLNSFTWGPDGWLYGTHGVFTQSNVGVPGTPEMDRVRLNGGVWRYHPTSRKFELFSEGTSNPWGIDFNDYGHSFITVCVIPHMFHAIQGARYLRQAGSHFNPHTNKDIDHIGDHVHWVGEEGPHAGNNRSNSKGGGHAHVGAMIYLGNEHWPKELRNNIFMNNIHGSRVNVDVLTREGSGYVASHGEDLLLTNDSWSQWLNFRYDPSGSIFAIDWYDKNQCHSPNPDVHDKTLGRIFKISHESDQWVQVDLSKATDGELVDYQLHKNEWYVRTARGILQERGPNKKVHARLKKILNTNPDITRKLRALWALHVTEGLTDKELIRLLDHESEHIRSWAIQLMAEDEKVSDTALDRFAVLAQSDESALVRLYLTSAVQRVAPEKRWAILEALVQREEDSEDQNIPLMLWYGLEPSVSTDLERALDLALRSKMPDILPFTIARVAAIDSPEADQALRDFQLRLKEMEPTHQIHQAQELLKTELAGI